MTDPYQNYPVPQDGPTGPDLSKPTDRQVEPLGMNGFGQYGQPPAAHQMSGFPGPPAFLLGIGDIAISEGFVSTPAGILPLRGAMWTATDMSQTAERTPGYAVVLAILFFPFCFIGLLFLLIREQKTTGYVQVTVTSEGRYHSTMIPVQNQQTFPMVLHQVNYARTLSSR
ncbi:hypothetical protein OG203_39870 [Nocardia sp. NBC_01499]|uniref:hypothetical protein n=1 Tax=Nocardia sp. NBC_01499 TaxID=2903597 RepID=UPI0038676B00